MSTKLLFRIPIGFTKLQVVAAAIAALKQDKQYNDNDISTELYDGNYTLFESYKNRATSLANAFSLIVNAISAYSNKEIIKNIEAGLKQKIDIKFSANQDVKVYQNALASYKDECINNLMVHWKITTKEANEWLNTAEQYDIMKRGRPDIATFSTVSINSGKGYILQWEEQQPPPASMAKDFADIKAQAKFLKTTPLWFKSLSPEQQCYLYDIDEESIESLKAQIAECTEGWSKIENSHLIIEANIKNLSNNPLLTTLMAAPIHQELKALNQPTTVSEQIKDASLKLANLNPIRKLPFWFLIVLPHYQQSFLHHVLSDVADMQTAAEDFFVSSRHRYMPFPANFCIHRTLLSTDGTTYQLLGEAERFRLAHVVSREMTTFHSNYSKLSESYSDNILNHLLKVSSASNPQAPLILIQTLISPVGHDGIGMVQQYIEINTNRLLQLPDPFLHKQLVKAINTRADKRILLINIPLNAYRHFSPWDANCEKFTQLVCEFIEVNPQHPKLKEIEELLADYKKLLEPSSSANGTYFNWDPQAISLCVCSLQHLLTISMGGISTGSCVSAKDRKAIELIHTDTYLLYHAIEGSWPVHNNPTSRQKFVQLFVELYLTRHMQRHAGQNAPGSDGLKHPKTYLAPDITNAIENKYSQDHSISDLLATSNEIAKIKRRGSPPLEKTADITVNNKIKEEYYEQIIAEFTRIVMLSAWSGQGASYYYYWTKCPDGISALKKILNGSEQTSTKLSASEKLIKCINYIKGVMNTPNKNRNESTKSFYYLVMELGDCNITEDHITNTIQRLKDFSLKTEDGIDSEIALKTENSNNTSPYHKSC